MDTKKNNQSLLIGVTGLILQVGGLFTAPLISDLLSIRIEAATLVGLGVSLLGTCILIAGMCLYAQAKEQSGWWGLMGLLGLIGLIVLSALPDRHEQRRRAKQLNADITQPPERNSIEFTCFGCGYTLNGITSGACPECGRWFDPANLQTVQVHDEMHLPKPPWTSRWSMICGVLGFVTFCAPPLGIIIPGLGVLFGHLAFAASRKLPTRPGQGVSIAGLVLSYISLLMGIGVLLFFISTIR